MTQPLRGSHRTLHEVPSTRPGETDRPAVTFVGGPSFSRGELVDAVAWQADALRSAGVGGGDRVCLLLSNGPELLVDLLAISALGAVSVPLNTALRGWALASTVDQMTPCHLITESAYAPEVDACRDRGADLSNVWYVDDPAWPHARASSAEPVTVEPWEPALILLTSGTTGSSKGVVWSHQMALTFAEHTTWVMGYDQDDVIYTCLPMFHINALFCAVLAGLQTGAHVVVAERFSASRFWGTWPNARPPRPT